MSRPHPVRRPAKSPEGPARGLRRLAASALGVLALTAGLLAAGPPATAASLTQVTGFGSNPGNLSMYAYVPDALPTGAPLVLALHGCTQSAGDYHAHSGWATLADRYGFAVVYPQTNATNNANSCFNWFEAGDSARGRGEALSIKQMADKAVEQYGSDPGRVHITGLSAGGGMTANMLAAYPDVFAGGAVASGLPARCAETLTAAYTCMYSPPDRTPAQWGDLVRSAAPAGTTNWPRVAIWQGTADTTVRPANATELRDQWTNAWGVGQTPSRTRSLTGGTTATTYDDPTGRPAVESTRSPAWPTDSPSTPAAAPSSAAPPEPTTSTPSAPATTPRASGAWTGTAAARARTDRPLPPGPPSPRRPTRPSP